MKTITECDLCSLCQHLVPLTPIPPTTYFDVEADCRHDWPSGRKFGATQNGIAECPQYLRRAAAGSTTKA